MLRSLCCLSRRPDRVRLPDLEQYLFASATRSRALNISGFLAIGETVILDLVEGGGDEVAHLRDALETEGERPDFRVVWEARTPVREFDRWSVARLNPRFTQLLIADAGVKDEAAAIEATAPEDLIDYFQTGAFRSGGAEIRLLSAPLN
ncbi:MAG: BLUF domain-containing protein [Pseudomonadota bacterium]